MESRLSLTIEASTNEGNPSELLEKVESYCHPIKDVGSGTIKGSKAEYDISAIQKSQTLQSMMYLWVKSGDIATADSSSISREGFGASVILSRKGTVLLVGVPTANLGTTDDDGNHDDNGDHDGKIETY